jgi:putative transposase
MTEASKKFKNKYRISSSRLKSWDYSTPGYYFVTICTNYHVSWFGRVREDKMILSPAGCIVAQELINTGQVRTNVTIESWVVMPNHVHAIIAINEPVETPRRGVSTKENPWRSGTLGAIINQFRSICTKRIRKMGINNFAWQARFYDHILRNE